MNRRRGIAATAALFGTILAGTSALVGHVLPATDRAINGAGSFPDFVLSRSCATRRSQKDAPPSSGQGEEPHNAWYRQRRRADCFALRYARPDQNTRTMRKPRTHLSHQYQKRPGDIGSPMPIRVPPETRLSSTTAPRRMRAALCLPPRVCSGQARSSRSIGGSSARKSRWACQYAGIVPTSRQ